MNKIDTAVNEIMGARVFVSSKDVCLDRLSAFYALDFPGTRGVASLRERQEVVGSRLAKLGYRWDPSELEFVFVGLSEGPKDKWMPREQRFSKFERNTRRAKSEGLYKVVFDFARSYDRHVRDLIKSNEAGFRWGGRGEQVVDWDYYAKSCRYPKKYYNAGVYVDFVNNRIEFETYQGIDVYVPLPKQIQSKNLTFEGLIDGDYFDIRSRRGGAEWVTRYALNEKTSKYRVCGYAMKVDGYWEHGETRADIEKEIEHKRRIDQRVAEEAAQRRRLERKIRLIARLCAGLVCTYQDARAVGYCQPGIDGFLKRYFTADTREVTAKQLYATGRPEIKKVIEKAAYRVATA